MNNYHRNQSQTFFELNVINNFGIKNEDDLNQTNTQIPHVESTDFITLNLGADECSICLEDINLNDMKNIYLLPCLHIYHSNCLYDWFDQKKEYICPICRKIFGEYPQEPYVEREEVFDEQRRICFGQIKLESFLVLTCLSIFWMIAVFALFYSRW